MKAFRNRPKRNACPCYALLVDLKLIDKAKVNIDATFRADLIEPTGK